MSINPFELHPDISIVGIKKEKDFLTKQEFYEIIDKKMEDISRMKTPSWGFTKYDFISMLLSIKTQVENHK